MITLINFRNQLVLLLPFFLLHCQGQPGQPGAIDQPDVEGTPAHLYGKPPGVTARDTSPGWLQDAQRILLTGTVYQEDGKTPAPGVLLYYYQTNKDGRYLHKAGEKRSLPPNAKGQTHGYIRGWVITDDTGQYAIYTSMPGAYPDWDEPAHIHLTIQEPGKEPYYIDDFVFDADKRLTSEKRRKMENRGGSGVLRMVQLGDLQVGERNIFLGLNVPGHPGAHNTGLQSGRNIGEDVLSFTPFHAWGPDKGSKTCPVCKYGWYHGILYFVGKHPDWPEIKQWLSFLEAESAKRQRHLKVYFIYGNEQGYDKQAREKLLAALGETLQLKHVALTFVPSFADRDSEIYLNRVNPETKNTFLLYKRCKVIDKYIDLAPTEENFDRIRTRLDQTINEYFDPAGFNGH